jgi:hypothetical protein
VPLFAIPPPEPAAPFEMVRFERVAVAPVAHV